MEKQAIQNATSATEQVPYTEFAERSSWGGGDILRRIVDRRMIKTLRKIQKQQGCGSKLLEIGSGTGCFAKEALRCGAFVYRGVEPNPTLAALSRRNSTDDAIIEASLPEISTALLEWADLCVSFHVLEHARDGYEAREWLKDMVNCVRPGGLVVVVSPDIKSYRSAFWTTDWSHCFPTSPENVSQLFADNGLELIVSTTIRGGSTGRVRALASRIATALTPSLILDTIGKWTVGRPLGAGLKVGYLYANTFVVGKKPE